MHPVLFEFGSFTIYSYGVMIAIGVIAGVAYMTFQGKKDVGLTFDQANSLFLLIFVAAFVGGKVFFFFESPSKFLSNPAKLFSGSGFVFYGSFLFAVPAMLWFFKRHKLDTLKMLDVMAIVTCLVHMFGRIGCFLAGCCYGVPTEAGWGVIFTDVQCKARPLNEPLVPTQLIEAGFIFLVMLTLLFIKSRFQRFKGQLFLLYLASYAVGRSFIEMYRGDEVRGYVIDGWLSHSQFVAFAILLTVIYFYRSWSKKYTLR